MANIDAIVNFRRFLKRRNHSPHTVKNYLNRVKHFVVWLDVPLEEVTPVKVLAYIDYRPSSGEAAQTQHHQLSPPQHQAVL